MADCQKILERYDALKAHRDPFLSQWDEVAFYCLPESAVFSRGPSTDGQERKKPVDSTGIGAAQDLASGLFSNTVALGQEWFSLRATSEDLAKDDEVSAWLGDVRRIALRAMQNSNFALVVQESFLRYAVMGTAVVFSGIDQGRLSFAEYAIQDCVIDENAWGQVNCLFREYWFSALQAEEKWGMESLSPTMREALNDPAEAVKRRRFLHAVFPRRDREMQAKDGKNKAFASYHIEMEARHIVSESGFDSFPYAVPRFYREGSARYGYSPANQALPDLRMVNRAVYDIINGIEMGINPPLFLPGGSNDPNMIDLRPGMVNPINVGADGQMPAPYATQFRFDWGWQWVQDLQSTIRGFFFADLFRALEDQKRQMTATEIEERISEKIQSIAPVVARLQTELYAPLVERVVLLLAQAGLLPPPPEKLLGPEGEAPALDFTVIYTTRLDSKLSQVELANLGKTVGFAAQVVEGMAVLKDLAFLFNLDKVVRFAAEANNVPPDLLRPQAEVDELRKKQAEAAAAQAQQQAAMQSVKPIDPLKAVEPGSPVDLLSQEASSLR